MLDHTACVDESFGPTRNADAKQSSPQHQLANANLRCMQRMLGNNSAPELANANWPRYLAMLLLNVDKARLENPSPTVGELTTERLVLCGLQRSQETIHTAPPITREEIAKVLRSLPGRARPTFNAKVNSLKRLWYRACWRSRGRRQSFHCTVAGHFNNNCRSTIIDCSPRGVDCICISPQKLPACIWEKLLSIRPLLSRRQDCN